MLPAISANIGVNMSDSLSFGCSTAPAIEHGRTVEILISMSCGRVMLFFVCANQGGENGCQQHEHKRLD